MAARGVRTRVASAAPPAKVDATYFYLITTTPLGFDQTPAQRSKARAAVNETVTEVGGKCTFFAVHGSSYDFVSVVTGVDPAGAQKIAEAIDASGFVKATMIWGSQTRK